MICQLEEMKWPNSSIVHSLHFYDEQTLCDYCAFIVSSVSIQLGKQGYIDSAPDIYSRDLKIIVQVVCITYDNYITNFLISFPTTALCIQGAFTNYVDKKRWVGTPIMLTFCQCLRQKMSTQWSKKAKNLSTQFVNAPLLQDAVS